MILVYESAIALAKADENKPLMVVNPGESRGFLFWGIKINQGGLQ